MSHVSRRIVLGAAATTVLAYSLPARAGKVVRVGYQKYGSLLLLKVSKLFEARVKPLGYSVEWREFISGPPLMEALGAGAIDFGSAGETPPIFAQAAGADIVYIGAEPPAPRGEAILLKAASPIRTLADLKGKRVGFNKGSNVHVLYVRALEKAGLAYDQVTPVYLAPTDGRAAFERGAIDAWVIWDPFFAAAQAAGETRVLTDGTGLAANRQFYLGARRFTDRAVIAAFKAAVGEMDRAALQNLSATTKLAAPSVGLPEAVVRNALERQTWSITPIDAETIAQQQAIADAFFTLRLIPKQIRIADAVPTPS